MFENCPKSLFSQHYERNFFFGKQNLSLKFTKLEFFKKIVKLTGQIFTNFLIRHFKHCGLDLAWYQHCFQFIIPNLTEGDIKNPEVMRNDARSGQVSWLFVAMTFLIESREETDTEGNTILLLRGEILPGSSSSAHICTVMMRYRFDVCLFDLLCCKQHIKDCKGGTDSSFST